MESAICQVFEYLIIHVKYESAKQRRTDCLEGTLLVSINAENSRYAINQLHCHTIIAGAGALSSNITENLYKEIKGTLAHRSIRLLVSQEEISCLHETLGIAPFQLMFEIDENTNQLMLDCLAIKQFLHRISIAHPKVKVHYCIKVNEAVSAETYSKKKNRVFNLNGIHLRTDSTDYFRSASHRGDLHCTRIHPVHWKNTSLLIPNQAAEMGLSGELQLVPIAALCPCSKIHPNKPSRISAVSIFLYSTSGLPILFQSRRKSLLFFEDASRIAEWEIFNVTATLNLGSMHDEDEVTPDIRYNVGTVCEQQEGMDTEEQTLLLFLFMDYSDTFQSELQDLLRVQRTMAYHTDQIFQCNEKLVKDAVQSVLKMTLEKHFKAEKSQVKLQFAQGIAVDSICSIVTNSTNNHFRTKCLRDFQVTDAREFRVAVQHSLQRTSLNRVLISQTCDVKNGNEPKLPPKRVLPTASRHISPGQSQSDMGTDDSEKRDYSFDTLNPEENMNKRKRTAHDKSMEDPRSDFGCHFQSDVLLSCSVVNSDTTRAGGSGFPTGRNNLLPIDSENMADNTDNLDQEDDLWLREVSNLSDWAY